METLSASFVSDRLNGKSSLDTLKRIRMKCRFMVESEPLCCCVRDRLVLLHDRVAPLDTEDPLKRKYVNVMVRLNRLMERKPLLMRLAKRNTTVQVIRELHLELDDVTAGLGLVEGDAAPNWQEDWDKLCLEQQAKLAGLVVDCTVDSLTNEMKTDKKLQEVLMALQSELETDDPPEIRQLKRTTYNRALSYAKLKGPSVFYWFISSEDVECEDKPFGIGTFGEVCRGSWLHDGERQNVVVKRLFKETASAPDEPFLRQLEIWSEIPDHPNVLKLYGGCHVSSPQFYVCEDAHHGNLVDFLGEEANKGRFWSMFLQVAQGLAFLHARNTVHGGLKCYNILVGDNYTAKLGDFGFSAIRNLSIELSINKSRAQIQSVRWKPKEMLMETGSGKPPPESDIYSLGMCMIEAITQEIPFGMTNDTDVMDLIMKGGCHPRPEDVPIADETWEMIMRLCASDFHDRPPLETVIEEIGILAAAENLPAPDGA
ncbi:hypothetical protein BBJ28_00011864 [Nothophytophthora sp. Chile5]|nr:hypothetical protein BBJ28_00011864 [Nothophytophthora sp. Chile5]